ncbi:collagen-like triple helix repeat-containing protein [Oceanobacillus timonensis]|uniref:collagen-like triple helix repeat-containing protein n=1 Tax=Oceanobacillus timonensis TaxID=1926285 RepID=UPI0009B9CBF0|nr:collagen-like protein [Oceanobacillus timonensis]
MATKAELKERLVKGHVITEQDVQDLIDVAGEQGPEGPQGEQGPRGEKGNKGAVGEQGPAGADGEDGFPTETQWNELIARVDTLEGNTEGE